MKIVSDEKIEIAPDKAVERLQWLDMSAWDSKPIPERKWAIRDRVPLKQAGLFSGEGGAGKSIIELMKDVAHVAAKDWLGSMPEPGPAFYLGAEDDKDEIHIRLAAIAKHYDVTFKKLTQGGLHVLPLLGEDATLCAVGKSGRVEVTRLYRQIYEAAGDIKPKNISIDTLSRAFSGNEIDRVQVYGFAMHMQALAMVSEGSVTVLSHPSLAGISSGTGLSGSTAWHGAFRFRQYLKSAKADAGEQPDNDLRELEFTSAASSCPKREFAASTRRRVRQRQRTCLWTCCAALVPRAAMSARTRTRRPTPPPNSSERTKPRNSGSKRGRWNRPCETSSVPKSSELNRTAKPV